MQDRGRETVFGIILRFKQPCTIHRSEEPQNFHRKFQGKRVKKKKNGVREWRASYDLTPQIAQMAIFKYKAANKSFIQTIIVSSLNPTHLHKKGKQKS